MPDASAILTPDVPVDGLTSHHMPQAAANFTSRDDGGAVVMTHAGQHAHPHVRR